MNFELSEEQTLLAETIKRFVATHYNFDARAKIIASRRHAQVSELVNLIVEHGQARMPVYEDSLDKIIGYVVAKDVILWSQEPSLLVLDDIMRPAYFVPESTRAADVLKEMQRRRTQIAVLATELRDQKRSSGTYAPEPAGASVGRSAVRARSRRVRCRDVRHCAALRVCRTVRAPALPPGRREVACRWRIR